MLRQFRVGVNAGDADPITADPQSPTPLHNQRPRPSDQPDRNDPDVG